MISVKRASACVSNPCFCIQLNEIGEVTIKWDNTNFSVTDFHEYQFYADTGNGFVMIGAESDSNSTSFTFPNYNIGSSSINCFMKIIYGANNNLINTSDTLSSIHFDLLNLLDGNVSLSWNHPIPIDSIPINSYYIIEKSNQVTPAISANWIYIDSISKDSTHYLNHINLCSSWLNYRVRLITNNCDFISNMDGGLIEDQTAPDAPSIKNVSTDTINNHIVINWSSSVAQDVAAYIIFKFSGGTWNPIDTVYGLSNTTYIDTASSTFQNSVVQYAIAAMDSCSYGLPAQNNTSSAGLEHQNIILTHQYDQCSGEVSLSWNEYINFSTSVNYYQIFYKNDLQSWTLIDTTSNLSYIYTLQEGDLNYGFTVIAIADSTNYNSLSNQTLFYANQPPIPQFSYLSGVSVFGDTISLSYLGENGIGINAIHIYRSDDNGVSYIKVDSILNPVFPIIYNDLSAFPSYQSYSYQIAVIDSCNNEVAFSNIGKSIFLESQELSFLSNEIFWNSYNKWQNGVENYELFYSNNVNGTYQSLIFLDSSVLSYNHDFSSLIESPFNGRMCYKIIANETTNDLGISGESISNLLCIDHEPLIFIPNALNVNGINNRWKPSSRLIDFSDFKVSIFSRNGSLIYELTSEDDFWDGTVLNSGILAPLGVYVYSMEFKNSKGDFFKTNGNITLIK